MLIDSDNEDLYVFAKSDASGQNIIYMKSTNLNNLQFQPGLGTPFIESATDLQINNPTSMKQFVNNTTGLLVMASDKGTDYYFHNYLELSSAPVIFSFSPAMGQVNTLVTIDGKKFSGATEVRFNGIAASSFSVVSANQIEATVPAGATTGPISVISAGGTGTSTDDFEVTIPPYTLTTTNIGYGGIELNPPGNNGVYDTVTVVTLTAIPDSGYVFYSWSGDVNGDKNVTARFIPQFTLSANASGSGTVVLDPPGGTYDSATVVTVTAIPDSGYVFTGWSGDLSGTTNPDTILINADKSVTGTFAELSSQQYTLNISTIDSGSVILDPPGGVYSGGTVVTLTALPHFGYDFQKWSGDLSGSINPEAIFMDSEKNVTAKFVAQGASTVTFEEIETGSASDSMTVTTSSPLTGEADNLYLAAISTRGNIPVSSVSGLGLTWTLLYAQCSGRAVTGVEVWMAQGMPIDSGLAL
jgi:uncharacterized repeat protein (TIGR02543 family)